VFTAQEVEEACESSFDKCYLEIKLESISKDPSFSQDVTIFAGYTDHPLILLDGISHSTQIKT
jgi:hypothetical protein